MPPLQRAILIMLMTLVMVFAVTFVATLLNLGMRPDFAWQWFKAYVVAWPVAALTGFLIMPAARRLTDIIVRALKG
jgi:hypothetical protein